MTIAALLLLGVVWLRGRRLPRAPTQWGRLAIQAVLNSIGAWVLLAWGQQHVTSGLAGVLNSTSPVFVFIITALVTRHEAVNAQRLGGALLGVAGVVLIVGVSALDGIGRDTWAQLAVLASAMLYALAAVHGKRFQPLGATVTAASTMLIASVCLIPVSLWIDAPWQLSPSPRSLAAAVVLGLACTGIAMLLYFRLLSTLGSMGTASQSFLRAGVSVLLGMLILGEQLAATTALGVVCAIAGVALINLRFKRRAA